MWKSLHKNEKEAYKIESAKKAERERGVDGRFSAGAVEIPVVAGEAVVVPIAAVVVPGEAEPAGSADAAGSAEAPVTTPKKSPARFRQHGSAMMDGLSEWIHSKSTPPKEKKLAAQILHKVAASRPEVAAAVSKHLHGKFKNTCAATRNGGRPKGSCKVSDEVIVDQLQKVSIQSSQMHRTLLRPIWTLGMSKRRAAKALNISRSTLQRRTKRGALGFAPAATQRGKCDACMSWQSGGRRRLSAAYQDARKLIEAVMPLYFQSWDEQTHVHDEWELGLLDDPETVASLAVFLKDHASTSPHLRAALTDEQGVQLVSYEVQLQDALEASQEDVANWSWHLQMKRTLEVSWEADWRSPLPEHLYLLWDHMAA